MSGAVERGAVERETARRRGTRRRARRLRYAQALRSSASLVGGYHSLFRGQGMTFDDVRRYEPGDDVRFIDYNVSARLGETFVKRFIEERETPVLLAIDVSSSVTAGLGARVRRDTLVEVAEILALAASANGDPVGILTFSDRVHTFLTPRKGQRPLSHVLEAIEALDDMRRGTDLPLALRHAEARLARRSVVFLISDFLVEALPSTPRSPGSTRRPPGSGQDHETASDALNAALLRLKRRHTLIPIQIAAAPPVTKERHAGVGSLATGGSPGGSARPRDKAPRSATRPETRPETRPVTPEDAALTGSGAPQGLVLVEDAESGLIAAVDARHLSRAHNAAAWDGSAFGTLVLEAGADPLPVLERGLQRRRQALKHPRNTQAGASGQGTKAFDPAAPPSPPGQAPSRQGSPANTRAGAGSFR